MTEPFGLAEMRSLMAELRAQYRPVTPTAMPVKRPTLWIAAEDLRAGMELVQRKTAGVSYTKVESVVVGSKFYGSRWNLPKNPECVHVNGKSCFTRGQLLEILS